MRNVNCTFYKVQYPEPCFSVKTLSIPILMDYMSRLPISLRICAPSKWMFSAAAYAL